MDQPKLQPSESGNREISRGRFLRRAGAAGLAFAAVGDLVATPLARAATSRREAVSNRTVYYRPEDKPDACRGEIVCTRDPGVCNGGTPCHPSNNYCYSCVASNCGSNYTQCYQNEPYQFSICCN